jgi:hypothetical protein
VLYVPPFFDSTDGSFDLVMHYHGNVQLIEASVDALGLNALVYIVNLGEGSGRYIDRMRTPRQFDQQLDRIEERAGSLGLESPRIRRIALSSWSAGYGALYHVLDSRSRLDRVDAVLMMDSLHASLMPGSKSRVHPLSLVPFVKFAERAIDEEKLMVVTHSAVQTEGYADTTLTVDALLAELGLQRTPVDPDEASPEPVRLPVAVRAFPTGERRWMRVTSVVHEGNFHVYGATGKGKGDHITHLAQMSVTVLPPLVERWQLE